MGAEDPYLHMERTWNLRQGQALEDYPPGLMALLLPFTFAGDKAFYTIVRFLPAFFGVAAVACTFLLCRRYVHPTGALAAALLMATMAEVIFRTNILTPTALDLALVPLLLWATLRASEGERWAVWTTGGLAVGLLLVHPWVLALLLFPIGIFWFFVLWRQKTLRPWTVPAGAMGVLAIFALLGRFAVWNPVTLVVGRAVPRFGALVNHPGSFLPLPAFVDLPSMLTWPALFLAGAGTVVALRRRTRFALLALLWTFLLLPLVLVDWFDIWYIPHRTVAYLAIGVAMLAALAVAELATFLEAAKPQRATWLSLGALSLLLILMIPSAASVQPWYRIYDDNDFEAYEALDTQGSPFVMAGSWQARAGYRAVTGGDALYSPDFFDDEVVRQFELRKHPDMVVLIDNVTYENNHTTEFLQDWRLVGQWGDVKAYRTP